MIIIGSTQLTFTKATGSFHCPNCDQHREFRHRTKREFLTVYFIPLIPLQSVGEFVECSTCRGTFEPDVVRMTAEQIRASHRHTALEMIRRVLVIIVAADDYVSDEELAAVQDFAQHHELPDVTLAQILREAAAVRQSNLDVLQYVSHVAQQLSVEDQELLVHYAFLAATAAGDLSDLRGELLRDLPRAIGISEARFREIVAAAAERP